MGPNDPSHVVWAIIKSLVEVLGLQVVVVVVVVVVVLLLPFFVLLVVVVVDFVVVVVVWCCVEDALVVTGSHICVTHIVCVWTMVYWCT